MKYVFCLLLLLIVANKMNAQTIIIRPEDNKGFDEPWRKLPDLGKQCWGIKPPSDKPEVYAGNIWFDFTGETGTYKIEWAVVLEEDGKPYYQVFAGDSILKEGTYPYSFNTLDCTKGVHEISVIDMGTHAIKKNERIKIWMRSDMDCGQRIIAPSGKMSYHVAHGRWYELRFTKTGSRK